MFSRKLTRIYLSPSFLFSTCVIPYWQTGYTASWGEVLVASLSHPPNLELASIDTWKRLLFKTSMDSGYLDDEWSLSIAMLLVRVSLGRRRGVNVGMLSAKCDGAYSRATPWKFKLFGVRDSLCMCVYMRISIDKWWWVWLCWILG